MDARSTLSVNNAPPALQSCCRLCIESTAELTLVFKSSSNLFDRIYNCTGVRLRDFPGISQRICDVCTSQLVICERFIKQCQEADQKLSHWRERVKNEQIQKVPDTGGPENEPTLPSSATTDTVPIADCRQPKQDVAADVPTLTNDKHVVLHASERVDSHHECEIEQSCDQPEDHELPVESSGKVKSKRKSKSKKTKAATKGGAPKKQCQVCGSMQQNLKQHMLVHTGEKPHVCPYCNKAFAQKGNLTLHLNQHTGKCPYKCDQCDKAYPDPQALRSHKLVHTDERKYHCETCGSTFKYKNSFAVHLRGHVQNKRFACSECGCTFICSSGLKRHMRTHTGERPYTCSVCSKSFKTSSHLKLHKVSHTKERRFQCDLCKRWFSYKCVLKKHIESHLRQLTDSHEDVAADIPEQTKVIAL